MKRARGQVRQIIVYSGDRNGPEYVYVKDGMAGVFVLEVISLDIVNVSAEGRLFR